MGGHTVCCSWPSRSSGRVPRSYQPPRPCPWDQEEKWGKGGEKRWALPCSRTPMAHHCLGSGLCSESLAQIRCCLLFPVAFLRRFPSQTCFSTPPGLGWAAPSAWSVCPSFPGYSRDLLQDGEHPAPQAGLARDECLVVHDHPLIVVPAVPNDIELNPPWGHCPSLLRPPMPHTARNLGVVVASGCPAAQLSF